MARIVVWWAWTRAEKVQRLQHFPEKRLLINVETLDIWELKHISVRAGCDMVLEKGEMLEWVGCREYAKGNYWKEANYKINKHIFFWSEWFSVKKDRRLVTRVRTQLDCGVYCSFLSSIPHVLTHKWPQRQIHFPFVLSIDTRILSKVQLWRICAENTFTSPDILFLCCLHSSLVYPIAHLISLLRSRD